MRIAYRVQQFWHTLTAKPDQDDLTLAEKLLSPALLNLFMQMQASEQAHSISIARQLLEDDQVDNDLIIAALLHDVGKSRYPLRLWERTIIVVGNRLFPTKASQWGQGAPAGWRRAFVVAAQHPAWGAEMVAQAGASPMVVAIVRRHQDQIGLDAETVGGDRSLEDQLVYKLQLIDNES